MSEILSFILGLFLPPVVEFVKTKFKDNKIVNYSITLSSCAFIGVVSTIFEGKFNTTNLDTIVGSISTALLASQSVYNYYFRNSNLAKRIASLKK
jgi:uncharacterized membrane protein YqaE (UPF0057 family)